MPKMETPRSRAPSAMTTNRLVPFDLKAFPQNRHSSPGHARPLPIRIGTTSLVPFVEYPKSHVPFGANAKSLAPALLEERMHKKWRTCVHEVRNKTKTSAFPSDSPDQPQSPRTCQPSPGRNMWVFTMMATRESLRSHTSRHGDGKKSCTF